MLEKVYASEKLPLYMEITSHPAVRLTSRSPIWLGPMPEDMTAILAWSVEWSSTDVVNHYLVAEPIV